MRLFLNQPVAENCGIKLGARDSIFGRALIRDFFLILNILEVKKQCMILALIHHMVAAYM
jgi:hypothetical protein